MFRKVYEDLLEEYKYGAAGLEQTLDKLLERLNIDRSNQLASADLISILGDYNWKHKPKDEAITEIIAVGDKHGFKLDLDNFAEMSLGCKQRPARKLNIPSHIPIRPLGVS